MHSLVFVENHTAFKGSTYEAKYDGKRLSWQLARVARAMADGRWRTLREIGLMASAPEASASARLRDLRRIGMRVDIRRRGEKSRGLFEYRVTF